jgi:hypothetical protein
VRIAPNRRAFVHPFVSAIHRLDFVGYEDAEAWKVVILKVFFCEFREAEAGSGGYSRRFS